MRIGKNFFLLVRVTVIVRKVNRLFGNKSPPGFFVSVETENIGYGFRIKKFIDRGGNFSVRINRDKESESVTGLITYNFPAV